MQRMHCIHFTTRAFGHFVQKCKLETLINLENINFNLFSGTTFDMHLCYKLENEWIHVFSSRVKFTFLLLWECQILTILLILFPTKVNLENKGNLYSACSNLTCLSYYLSDRFSNFSPINSGAPSIKHPCLLSYPKKSLKQHWWDSNTCFKDYTHFRDSLRLKKQYGSAPRIQTGCPIIMMQTAWRCMTEVNYLLLDC